MSNQLALMIGGTDSDGGDSLASTAINQITTSTIHTTENCEALGEMHYP